MRWSTTLESPTVVAEPDYRLELGPDPDGRTAILSIRCEPGYLVVSAEAAGLATLEEMRICREIAERAWHAPRVHDHEFFYEHDTQLIRPWSNGPLRWPEGWG